MLWQEKFPSSLHRHLISQVLQTFLYGTNELFNHLFLSVLENSQSAVNGLSLSHFLSLYYFFLHILLFSFHNLFPSSLSHHQCILPQNVCIIVLFGFSVFNKYQSLNFLCHVLDALSPLLILNLKILTRKTCILVYVQTFTNVSYFFPSFFHLFLLQQLMRERQQMASRPFASVAVTLDVGGTQIELLQGGIEVSLTFKL